MSPPVLVHFFVPAVHERTGSVAQAALLPFRGAAQGGVELNAGRSLIELEVTNTGDRPIQARDAFLLGFWECSRPQESGIDMVESTILIDSMVREFVLSLR